MKDADAPTVQMGIDLAFAALAGSVDCATAAALAAGLAQHLSSEHSDKAAQALVHALRRTKLSNNDAKQWVVACMARGSQSTAALLAAVVSESKEAQQMFLERLPGVLTSHDFQPLYIPRYKVYDKERACCGCCRHW